MKISEKRALVQKRKIEEEKKKLREEKKIAREKSRKTAGKSTKSVKAKSSKGSKSVDATPAETLQIFPDARIFSTNLTNKFRNRKVWQRPDTQEIKSIIPGVVSSFEVKEGDHVEAGTHLLTYEAMKMQNIVLAPFAGTVEKIYAKVGEKTPKGVVLLYLKSDDEIVQEAEDDSTSGDLGLIV